MSYQVAQGVAYFQPISVVPRWQQEGQTGLWNGKWYGPAIVGEQLDSLINDAMLFRPGEALAYVQQSIPSYTPGMPGGPMVQQGWMQNQTIQQVQAKQSQTALQAQQVQWAQAAGLLYTNGLP